MIKSHVLTRTQNGAVVLQVQCDPPAQDGVEYKILSTYELANLVATGAQFLAEDEMEKIIRRG